MSWMSLTGWGHAVIPALCQAQQELPVCRPEVLDFHHSLFNVDLSSLKEIFVLSTFTHATMFSLTWPEAGKTVQTPVEAGLELK